MVCSRDPVRRRSQWLHAAHDYLAPDLIFPEVSDAFALAAAAGITVYDATYLTLAVRLETQVITGDERLARVLAGHPLLAPHVRSLRDFAR
jgi:predicted nucleic acid-binding protein